METIFNKIKFNQLFAILMAMFCALSLSFTSVHAIGQEEKVTVNVQVEPGDTVDIYKIIDVNYDFTSDQPQNPMYTWDANIATWMNKNHSDKGYVGDNNVVNESFSANKGNPEAFQGFFQQLAAALETGTITGVTKTTTASSQLGMGEYLIVGKANQSSNVYLPTTIVVAPTFDDQTKAWKLEVKANDGVLTPGQDGTYTVNLKGSTLTFDKFINAKDQALVDMKTVGIGDTVNYVLKAAIPTYPANATNKTLTIEDTAGIGLTLPTAEKIKVYSDEALQNEVTQGVDKKVEGQTVTINLTYDTLVQANVSTIYVAYTATVNGNAPEVDALKNTAKYTFAKDPYVEGANGELTDAEVVFTYALDVTKVAEDQKTQLAGAQFTLKDNQAELNFVKNGEGIYTLASANDQNTTKILEVDSKGELVLKGLDTGSYTLTEIKPANGMVLPKDPTIKVTLTDTQPDGTLNEGKVESSIVPTTDGNEPKISGNTLSFKVVNSNKANFELPNTGGMGTLVFTVGGILLMAFAVIYLVATRTKEHK